MFNGPDYTPALDFTRLSNQQDRIKELMIDRKWRTLDQISSLTNSPASSVSAQLRHLRKERFGAYIVGKRRKGDRSSGLFEYQLINPREELEQLEMFI